MSMNKSRKIAGVIRELMEVSVKAIGAKLPLLFQTLSQLVGACFFFFFIEMQRAVSQRRKFRDLSSSHVVNLVQLRNQCM